MRPMPLLRILKNIMRRNYKGPTFFASSLGRNESLLSFRVLASRNKLLLHIRYSLTAVCIFV